MPFIYYMEGHKLYFDHREFSLIIDFRFGTVSFDLHSFGELKFQNRVFPNKIGFSITNLDIIGVSEDEEIFGKLYDDDAIRLCLLLALEALSHKRSDRQAKLKFTSEFLCMTSDLCDSLNSMFADLIEPANPDEDIAQDYLREEELRLCLKVKKKSVVNIKNKLSRRIRLGWMRKKDRNFWLKLVCLDPARKGWLTEELLLQNGMPLFMLMGRGIPLHGASLIRYLFQLMKREHWCLAQFRIMSGEVTFYDTGHTYDYDYRDWLTHGLSLDVDDPVDVALAYREKMIYEAVYGGGCFDVSGSFKGFDYIEEHVGCDDGSLPVKIKDEFENEVILDDVVSSLATFLMLLKRKGKSRVKFIKMRGIIKSNMLVGIFIPKSFRTICCQVLNNASPKIQFLIGGGLSASTTSGTDTTFNSTSLSTGLPLKTLPSSSELEPSKNFKSLKGFVFVDLEHETFLEGEPFLPLTLTEFE
nr:phospholipase-like protein [Tanacetum cinerariifolium]